MLTINIAAYKKAPSLPLLAGREPLICLRFALSGFIEFPGYQFTGVILVDDQSQEIDPRSCFASIDSRTSQVSFSINQVSDVSQVRQDTYAFYAKRIIEGIIEVKELLYVMFKRDDGKFLRQMTDLIFDQFMTAAIPFFQVEDSAELNY